MTTFAVEKSDQSKRRFIVRAIKHTVTIAFVVLGCLVFVGINNARSTPVMREISVSLPSMPRATTNTRIALLSDVHLGNIGMTQARLSTIVDQITAARPDLVLIAGDFVSGHDSADVTRDAAGLTQPLAKLRAPLGVVAVLGNHDHWSSEKIVTAELERAGITVIENQALRRGRLSIVGIGDRFSGRDAIGPAVAAARNVGSVPVVITHSPDIAPQLPDASALFSPATHCGQVVLPWVGPLVMHSPKANGRRLYDPRYRCGVVRDALRTTIVTAGVGSGTIPIRLGALPDWWLITVVP